MREDEAMAPCEIDHRLGRGDAEFFRLMISLAGVLLVAPHRGWAELRSTGRTNASAPTHTKPNASLLIVTSCLSIYLRRTPTLLLQLPETLLTGVEYPCSGF